MASLQLTSQKPLASGSSRLIFQHPHYESILVKVMKSGGKTEHARKSWYVVKPRENRYLLFSRELHEFIVAEANSNGRPRPIPRIFGLIETDLGLGLTVEKLCTRSGELAPTLATKLSETGLTSRHEEMLLDLITEINRHRIVLIEFKIRNIVIVEDRLGQERLMLVDGYGDSSLFPLHSFSEFLNTRRNLRKYRKLIRRANRILPAHSVDIQPALLHRLYYWVLALANRPFASWALGGISFAESSFFPIPPDAMLIPMCLARPSRAFWYATICTVTSVLGGLLGYAIGYLMFDTAGRFLINLYGYGAQVEYFKGAYDEWGHWIIVIAGFTPFPFKVITITSGFVSYNLLWFVALSVLTRGARFYLVATLLYFWGDWARDFIERRLGLLATLSVILFIGGFVAISYFF